MKINLLKIDKSHDNSWTVEIETTDGATSWEKYRIGITEHEILQRLLQLKHYMPNNHKWQIFFCQDGRSFIEKSFTEVIGRGISYVELRDSPDEDGIF